MGSHPLHHTKTSVRMVRKHKSYLKRQRISSQAFFFPSHKSGGKETIVIRNRALPKEGLSVSPSLEGRLEKNRGNPSFVAGGVGMVTGRQMPFSGGKSPLAISLCLTERKSELFNWRGRTELDWKQNKKIRPHGHF